MNTVAGVSSAVVYDAENHQAVFSVQVCFLFDLMLYFPVNNFFSQSCPDGSSWVEPALSSG